MVFGNFKVSREVEGLSVKLRTQDLDLYCRSYGNHRNSFI
jgi:hypothetical protein